MTARAMSSGWPTRPHGIWRVRASAYSREIGETSPSTSMRPGAMQFTLMRWRASSRASTLVNMTTPALEAQ